ncbi:MAG: quinone-dependent dihydroorotate dehydrogenase [Aquificales bacterium]|nr:quinone-dependent dihydroorotate dehydrogenase [Aquificales bacterium]
MQFYKNLFFPAIKQFDPELAHDRTLDAIEQAQRFAPGRAVLRQLAGKFPQRPLTVCGLNFPNVLGIAAGYDKDVRIATGLGILGFGHIEVGTLTPKPQAGNPKPRIFRLPEDEAVINRMGFPNGGVETAVPRLRALYAHSHDFILGVSVGKQKETPLSHAALDYVVVMQAVYPFANYLAINISSPNTPGLRELQSGRYLNHLLNMLMVENKKLAREHHIEQRPLFVKIAPDLTWPELDEILTAIQDNHIDGIIATNTTWNRDGLRGKHKAETGGLSGRPLATRSTEIIRYIAQQTQGQLPIIGVGGIATANDVKEKLDAGASLVQIYTSFIYEGPGIAGHILRDLYQT